MKFNYRKNDDGIYIWYVDETNTIISKQITNEQWEVFRPIAFSLGIRFEWKDSGFKWF